jgi:N-hydroxyarylamine O-acetyltransferase
MPLDLPRYLERIGFAGRADPTLATLQQLHLHHVAAIPFENLNPLLRWPVPLDVQAVHDKIVRGGRGGYCFEQNLLFAHVLEAIGFRVTPLAARVLWGRPEDAPVAPRSHMLLRVEVEGEVCIADVGFGGLTLTGPLRLVTEMEQQTPHELFRLVETGAEAGYRLQAKVAREWRTLYRFDLQRQYQADYEVSNHFLTTHPSSPFIARLMAARPTADRRYALLDNELAVHHLNGPTERRTIASGGELREVLERDFLLTLPSNPELDAALELIASVARR